MRQLICDVAFTCITITLMNYGSQYSPSRIWVTIAWPFLCAKLYFWTYGLSLCALPTSRSIGARQGVHDLISTIGLNWFATFGLMVLLHRAWNTETQTNWSKIPLWIVICTAVNEVLMYTGHRFLHTKTGYPYHKKHHRLKTVVPIGSIYCSVVEHLGLNLMPLFLGPLLCQSSRGFSYAWLIIGIRKTIYDHSNATYASMPGEMKHTIHHKVFSANFATTSLLDRLFNTFQESESTKRDS